MSNMVVNTNAMALNSHRALKNVGTSQSKASEKLSTGLRINRAADDAAGLAISEKMRSQIRGLDQASRNAQDGISLIQTAEGALQESEDMLQRMRELVEQAATDTLEQKDRDLIALELDELSDEIEKTAQRTEFNKKTLIDGRWENTTLYFQVGANSEQGLEFNIDGMSATHLGVTKASIGDIVRKMYNNSVVGTDVGATATSGVYNPAAFDVSFETKGTYDISKFGTAGTIDLGGGNSIKMDANGNITATGSVTADSEASPLGSGLKLEDLVGKSFTNAAGTETWKITQSGGAGTAIEIAKDTLDLPSSSVNFSAVTGKSQTYAVGGVTLTINDQGAVSSDTALYAKGGDGPADDVPAIVAADGALQANTNYFDDAGDLLFSTGATASDIITYEQTSSSTARALGTTSAEQLYGAGAGKGIVIDNNSSNKLAAGSASVYDSTGTEVLAGGASLTAGTYYDTNGVALFEVTTATAGSMEIKEFAATTTKLEKPAVQSFATGTSDTGFTISDGSAADGIKFTLGADGSVKLDSPTGVNTYVTGTETAAQDGDALTANTNYYDDDGKLLFSTGASVKDIKTYTYGTAGNLAATDRAGATGLANVTGTVTPDGAEIFAADYTAAGEPDSTAFTTGNLANDTTYFDENGNALFYATSNGNSAGEVEKVTGTNTVKLQTPDVQSVSTDADTKVAFNGSSYVLSGIGATTDKKIFASAADATAGTNNLSVGDTLAVGDYFNEAGEKIFSVTGSGSTATGIKKYTSQTPTATPGTPADVYTTGVAGNIAIGADGKVAMTGFSTLKSDSGTTVSNGATAESLNNLSFTDQDTGETYTFKVDDGAADPAEKGKVYYTAASDPTTKVYVATTAPVAGVDGSELGTFAAGLPAGATGNLAINANGELSIAAGQTLTSTEVDAAGDPEVTLDDAYDFNTQTDHYGKTFKLSDDATISFDDKGKATLQDTSSTASIDYTKMNVKAQDAASDFNTKMAGLVADGSSHGKVISLLTDTVDAAIEVVSAQRAKLGAYQNRLEHTIKNLDISSENLTNAESRIRDTDMAKEMMAYTRSNVLQQAATSMLAQANQAPQNVLQLLR